MKLTKKITAHLLLCAMLAASLSCGSESNGIAETTASSSGEDTTSEAKSEYVAPSVDFNGKTVSVAACQWETPWQFAKYNVVATDEENGDVINDALVKRTQRVEEELNVNLELFRLAQRDKPTEFVNSVLAGDDDFAFGMIMSYSMVTLLATPGMLVDLNGVSSIDFSKSWWDKKSVAEMEIFGKQYAALGEANYFSKGSPLVIYFNQQLVEDYKLSDPYKLVDEGKWTLDRMIEMANTVSEDLNGNGEIDLDDRFGFMSEPDTPVYALTGCGVRFSEHDDDGIEITIMGEKTVDALDKIIKLMNNKKTTLFEPDHQNTYGNVFFELLIPMLGANKALFFENNLLASLNMRNMEVDFGILPLPKYDESQSTYISAPNFWYNDFIVIPSTNTDLENTGHLIEAMNYYSQQYVTPAFIDNVVMNKAVRDEESARMVKLILDTMDYDIANIFNWGNLRGTVTSMKNDTDKSYASVYDSSRSAILAAVESTEELLKGN